ncbi:MAG: hypothetical protein WCF22_07895 [Candidatus Sulfotelmatobacter sp.]
MGFERTNLLSKIIERWKDVPPAPLRQIDWRDSLYGYIGMEDHTLDSHYSPWLLSYRSTPARERSLPQVGATILTG